MQSSPETESTKNIKGWFAKTGKDVGKCKESIFYFLVACHDWPVNHISLSLGAWAPVPSARKSSHMLGSGYI